MTKVTSEDLEKLKQLNEKVGHHLTEGHYGEETDARDGTLNSGLDDRDRETMKRSDSHEAVHQLHHHLRKMLS